MQRLARYRAHLGSLSMFIRHLKRPIALRVKREYKLQGHVFEQRLYSGALLNEQAVLTAARYVDLNPHRAQIAASLHAAAHTSIQQRVKAIVDRPERLNTYLAPIASGNASWYDADNTHESNGHAVGITLYDYIQLLNDAMATHHADSASSKAALGERRWIENATLLDTFRRRLTARAL